VADVEWRSETPDDWTEAVDSWEWQKWTEHDTQLGWLKYGPCPRCEHTIAIYQEFGVLSLTDTVPAACNCDKAHAGRPDDDPFRGCGPQAEVAEHP